MAEANKNVTKTEKKVKIRLPRIKGESDTLYVSINERNWLIKRGVTVEVPECVAKLLEEIEEAQEEAYQRREAAKNASK